MNNEVTWDFAKLYQPNFDQAFQQQQLQNFKQQGFPTRRHEDWKYTNVAAIASSQFDRTELFAADALALSPDLAEAHTITIVDGYYCSKASDFPEEFITVRKAAQPIEAFSAVKTNTFALMAEALLTDGMVIEIKANAIIDKPIQLFYLSTQANKQWHTKVTVLAGNNCEATVFEHFKANHDQCYFANVITQLLLSADAKLNYYKLQQDSAAAYHISNLGVLQKANSRFTAYHFPKGAVLARDDIAINLDEQGAECRLYGFYNLKQKSHYDCHSLINHLQSHTRSEQNYKGIIDDQARAVFNGKVIVAKGTQQVSALQSNKNLLLSKQAEVDTKPELEIYADDVKCSHGATVGQLDNNHLFYLQSRGIAKAEAIQMLTLGFANEILQKLPSNYALAALIAEQVLESSYE